MYITISQHLEDWEKNLCAKRTFCPSYTCPHQSSNLPEQRLDKPWGKLTRNAQSEQLGTEQALEPLSRYTQHIRSQLGAGRAPWFTAKADGNLGGSQEPAPMLKSACKVSVVLHTSSWFSDCPWRSLQPPEHLSANPLSSLSTLPPPWLLHI